MKVFEFDGKWTTEYQFETFKGLLSRRGSYTSKSSDLKSDGTISLTINDEPSRSPDPTVHQINAINYLINHQQEVREAMRLGIDSIYEDLKKQYGYDENDSDSRESFPQIDELVDYDKVFGVGNVFIQLPYKDEHSYIGIECGCTWDEEHGLGFLLHKNRLVGIGDAEEAFNWKAYKDNGTLEEVLQEQEKREKEEPIKYKPHPKYGKLKPSQFHANEAYESNLIRRGFNNKFKEGLKRGTIELNGVYKSINQTYLELAVSSRNHDLTKYLLNEGVDIRYAFVHASKDLNMIDILIDSNGNINSKDRFGDTILHHAAKELVSLYDSRNQSRQYNWGREAEMEAKIDRQKEHISQIMIRGADPVIKNRHEHNCFDVARNLPKDQQEEVYNFMKERILTLNRFPSVGSRKWWQIWKER